MIQRYWFRFVRFAFRLLYNEMAWAYDMVSWLVSLGEWRTWQRAGLSFVVGKRVLEIGHGTGHMLLALVRWGLEPVGLDISPQMGRLAERRLQRMGLSASLVRGQAQTLPFAPAVFDTVLVTFPTAFIVDPATITAIYQVLRPGGRCVIIPEGHLTGTGTLHRFIDWLFRITGQREGAFAEDETTQGLDEVWWWPFRRRFTAVGFHVQIHPIHFRRSMATVIVAHKEN